MLLKHERKQPNEKNNEEQNKKLKKQNKRQVSHFWRGEDQDNVNKHSITVPSWASEGLDWT